MYIIICGVHTLPRKLLDAQFLPADVERALVALGDGLKIARLRRRMTQAEAAARLGVDRRTVAGMEAGAPQSAIGLVAGAIWLYGLPGRLAEAVDPDKDLEGRELEGRERRQVARAKVVDDDF